LIGTTIAITTGMATPCRPISDLLLLVFAEYLEIPDLRLTLAQIKRLWEIDTATAEMLMTTLTHARLLQKTRSDAYVREGHDHDARSRDMTRRARRAARDRRARSAVPEYVMREAC
jgi:hypothetical protein